MVQFNYFIRPIGSILNVKGGTVHSDSLQMTLLPISRVDSFWKFIVFIASHNSFYVEIEYTADSSYNFKLCDIPYTNDFNTKH